jgi:molecular chaperone GrpE
MAENKPDVQDGRAAAGRNGDASAEHALDLLRRERADFLNYKRRIERERSEDRERVRAEIIERLLPLLDELERALTDIPNDLKTNPWVQGTALSRHQLTDALRNLGVELIGAEGEPFDPAQHETLFYETRPEVTERTVGAVIRPGYRLGERLLRPARVSVIGPPRELTVPEQPTADRAARTKE